MILIGKHRSCSNFRRESCAPLRPRDRDSFLRDVAAELEKFQEIGPGIIGLASSPSCSASIWLRAPPQRRK
jgi:hypothetical protein